jgi:hypothetical protein
MPLGVITCEKSIYYILPPNIGVPNMNQGDDTKIGPRGNMFSNVWILSNFM